MSKITLYGYAKCGTCKKAQKWLDEREVAYTFVDITTSPPPRKTLAAIAQSESSTAKAQMMLNCPTARRSPLPDRPPPR